MPPSGLTGRSYVAIDRKSHENLIAGIKTGDAFLHRLDRESSAGPESQARLRRAGCWGALGHGHHYGRSRPIGKCRWDELHNSLAGGNSAQVGIATDRAALPVGPLTPDPALKPDLALDPTKPLEP